MWKIKRHLRKDNARVGLQREELTILYKTSTLIVPSPALWLWQCIPLSMLQEENISFSLYILCFSFRFCFGITLESQVCYGFHWKDKSFLQAAALSSVPYCQFCQLIPVEVHNKFLPVLLLKTFFFFFCTKGTVQKPNSIQWWHRKAQSGLILLNRALTANPFPCLSEVKLISHLPDHGPNCINLCDYISDDCTCNTQFQWATLLKD